MPKKTLILAGTLLFLLTTSLISAGSNRIPDDCKEEQELSGKVIMTGNVPHNYLILQTGEKESYVIGGSDKMLKSLNAEQGNRIHASGCVTEKVYRPEASIVSKGSIYVKSFERANAEKTGK